MHHFKVKKLHHGISRHGSVQDTGFSEQEVIKH